VPFTATALLASLAALPVAADEPLLRASFVGTALVLALGLWVLWMRTRDRALTLAVMVRPQHYVQACAQSVVLLYWGWYWRPVYEALPLLLAQLLFAYAFDMLLAWFRRDVYTLGFGPFPVIFSINLFLWFKAEWFYLQFAMIAVGFAAKELIRWTRDGRHTHIFNPSSFPLAVFSIGLILTGTTAWTYGPQIATTQFIPPNIYLLLFLVGLPGQLLFGVTTMTMSAVVTTYAFSAIYFQATGAYFFVDSYIPVAVFLGMHLLFTDPSTSPRTEFVRIVFGVLYGLGNVVLFEVLGRAGVPAFYDKLLPVPFMNLSIRLIDRLVRSSWLARVESGLALPSLTPRRRNLAVMAVWATVFLAMTKAGAVGDSHPGHQIPFWQRACLADARGGCETLSRILATNCADGSGWACNDLGSLQWNGRVEPADGALDNFAEACEKGYGLGCENALAVRTGGAAPRTGPPQLRDYPFLLRTGKGPLPDTTPLELYARACEQGWPAGCQSEAVVYMRGDGVPRDHAGAAAAFDKACTLGHSIACSNLGLMQYIGDGITKNESAGLDSLQRACDLGHPSACGWLNEVREGRWTPPPGMTPSAGAACQ
jgi:hypothetical protein